MTDVEAQAAAVKELRRRGAPGSPLAIARTLDEAGLLAPSDIQRIYAEAAPEAARELIEIYRLFGLHPDTATHDDLMTRLRAIVAEEDELVKIRDEVISVINTPRSTLRDSREAVKTLDRVVPEIRRDLWPVVNRLAAVVVARRAR